MESLWLQLFFAWCTFLTSHKRQWTPGRGLLSRCGLTLSYWRLYQIFITGRGLSGCSRHRGNALWRKTAEHHLRLLTRLQRPPETSDCRKWGGSSCLGKNERWRPMTSCLLRAQQSSNVSDDEPTYSPVLVNVTWRERIGTFIVSLWFKG